MACGGCIKRMEPDRERSRLSHVRGIVDQRSHEGQVSGMKHLLSMKLVTEENVR